MTLTVALHNFGVLISPQTQEQRPRSCTSKWDAGIINAIRYTLTSQNVCHEKYLLAAWKI